MPNLLQTPYETHLANSKRAWNIVQYFRQKDYKDSRALNDKIQSEYNTIQQSYNTIKQNLLIITKLLKGNNAAELTITGDALELVDTVYEAARQDIEFSFKCLKKYNKDCKYEIYKNVIVTINEYLIDVQNLYHRKTNGVVSQKNIEEASNKLIITTEKLRNSLFVAGDGKDVHENIIFIHPSNIYLELWARLMGRVGGSVRPKASSIHLKTRSFRSKMRSKTRSNRSKTRSKTRSIRQ